MKNVKSHLFAPRSASELCELRGPYHDNPIRHRVISLRGIPIKSEFAKWAGPSKLCRNLRIKEHCPSSPDMGFQKYP